MIDVLQPSSSLIYTSAGTTQNGQAFTLPQPASQERETHSESISPPAQPPAATLSSLLVSNTG